MQCEARTMATFPAAEHHRPLDGTKLYCLTKGHTCEQLAQGCFMKVEKPEVEPWPFDRQTNTLTITQPIHTTKEVVNDNT